MEGGQNYIYTKGRQWEEIFHVDEFDFVASQNLNKAYYDRHIKDKLENKKLLHQYQYAYKRGISTSNALQNLTWNKKKLDVS